MRKRIALLMNLLLVLMVSVPVSAAGNDSSDDMIKLWVGGTQVTKENASDVYGDGKVSYDIDNNVLTLNGWSYEGDGYLYETYDEDDQTTYATAGIFCEESISIKLIGENTIKNTYDDTDDHYGDGVATEGDINFIGDGKLSVYGTYAVVADETVNIDGCSMELIGTNDGILATDVVIKNNAEVFVDADRDGILAYKESDDSETTLEGDITIENGANVVVQAGRDGIYLYKNMLINDSSVTVDATGDGIYSYDGSVTIESTKVGIAAYGPYLEGTRVSVKAGGDYGVFAYGGLFIDEKLTIASPENAQVKDIYVEKYDYSYGTIAVGDDGVNDFKIQPLSYTVSIHGLNYDMAVLVPAGSSVNESYCEMYEVEDFSEILNTEKDNYIFGGWYTDEACTAGNEFNFDSVVTSDKTIYAKWISNDDNISSGETSDDDSLSTDDGNTSTEIKSPETDDNVNPSGLVALMAVGIVGMCFAHRELKRKKVR